MVSKFQDSILNKLSKKNVNKEEVVICYSIDSRTWSSLLENVYKNASKNFEQ